MVTGWTARRQEKDLGTRYQRASGQNESERERARLVGERLWPDFEFVDYVRDTEGEFLGYFLGVPYDWSLMDEDLI